jgi:hypothetical protein
MVGFPPVSFTSFPRFGANNTSKVGFSWFSPLWKGNHPVPPPVTRSSGLKTGGKWTLGMVCTVGVLAIIGKALGKSSSRATGSLASKGAHALPAPVASAARSSHSSPVKNPRPTSTSGTRTPFSQIPSNSNPSPADRARVLQEEAQRERLKQREGLREGLKEKVKIWSQHVRKEESNFNDQISRHNAWAETRFSQNTPSYVCENDPLFKESIQLCNSALSNLELAWTGDAVAKQNLKKFNQEHPLLDSSKYITPE